MIFWDFKKAFFSLLIFSLLCLSFSCKKKEKADMAVKELISDSLSAEVILSEREGTATEDFSEYSDDAKSFDDLADFSGAENLEELIDTQSEEERIAESLEELENAADAVEDEEPAEEERFAEEFSGSDSLLLFSQLDDEVVESGYEDGCKTLVYSIGGSTKKNFYDSEYRLIKSDFWEISTPSDSKIVKSESFEYHNLEKNPWLKLIKYDAKLEKIYYAGKNVIEKTESYKLVKEKPYITRICLYTYDGEGRETEIKSRDFSYNDEEDTKRRSVFEKVIKYKYNKADADGNEIPPDRYYYENGELKSYEKYTSVYGTYTMGYYFDKKYSVVTVYQNNQKVREIIYFDGNPVRIHRNDEEGKKGRMKDEKADF